MQKNKFIHEDIKAVCSSATKKLFSLGVLGAVSITLGPNTAFAGGCHSHFVRQQVVPAPPPHISDEEIARINAALDEVEASEAIPMPPEMARAFRAAAQEARAAERRARRTRRCIEMMERLQNMINRVMVQIGTNDELNEELDDASDTTEFSGDGF